MSRTKSLSGVLLFLAIFGVLSAATTIIQGEIGTELQPGAFSPYGNAGKITLMNESQVATAGIPGLTLEGDSTNAYLTGNIYLQTVGYVNINGANARVTPPNGADQNLSLPWEVNGNVWSDNAGWITLESLNTSVYSGVYYIPTTGSLTGIAWSETLGYIDFSGNSSSGSELVSRVKVIGNAGGMKSFESLFVANNGVMQTNSILAPFINTVRKNVGILTRNITDSVMNVVPTTQKALGNIIYYRLSGETVNLSTVSNFCTNNDAPRSLIVEGGNILIDRDVTGSSRACTIISLSRDSNGGNIFINSTPKVLQSYIIAEGTVYAGTALNSLYNDTKVKLANLPQNQLYILGGIISRNTIGGATTQSVSSGACPFTEENCNRDTAIKYDLNFFRNYPRTPETRAYTKNDSLENYSLIIEYDSRAVGDIPPGL